MCLSGIRSQCDPLCKVYNQTYQETERVFYQLPFIVVQTFSPGETPSFPSYSNPLQSVTVSLSLSLTHSYPLFHLPPQTQPPTPPPTPTSSHDARRLTATKMPSGPWVRMRYINVLIAYSVDYINPTTLNPSPTLTNNWQLNTFQRFTVWIFGVRRYFTSNTIQYSTTLRYYDTPTRYTTPNPSPHLALPRLTSLTSNPLPN